MKKYLIILSLGVWLAWAGNIYAFDELEKVAIHGFISQGYFQSDKYDYLGKSKKGSFEFNEIGLNFTSQLNDDLRIGVQLFAMDLGRFGNDEITVDWAFGDYRLHNMLGIRAGKFKVAHGLYNETRDIDAVRTHIFMPRSVYDPATRDTHGGMKGINAYGELPGGFSYHASYGVVPGKTDNAIGTALGEFSVFTAQDTLQAQVAASLIAAGVPPATAENMAAAYVGNTDFSYENQNVRVSNSKNFALRWAPTFLDGLKLSATYFGSQVEFDTSLTIDAPADPIITGGIKPDPVTTYQTLKLDEVSGTVFSLEYMWNNLLMAGEYQLVKVDVADANTQDIVGWYAGASYRFTHWFELGGYYSDYNTDRDDKDGQIWVSRGQPAAKRWIHDTCLSARFDFNEFWIFKAEAHAMRGLYGVAYEKYINPGDTPDEGWWLFAGKITYSF